MTQEQLETLLAEAAHTLKNLPGVNLNQRTTSWPETSYYKGKKAYPSAGTISRLDRTLENMLRLNEQERRIIWARTSHISWRKISEKEKLSHVTLRKYYQAGLKKLSKTFKKNSTVEQNNFLPSMIIHE